MAILRSLIVSLVARTDQFDQGMRKAAHYHKNREKNLATQRAYREKKREELREKKRAHYQANAERIKAQRRTYRQEHADTIRVTKRRYHHAHREEKRSYMRTYERENAAILKPKKKAREAARYQQNREAIRQQHAEYVRLHPEVFVMASARRRALKTGAPLNDFTAQQWQEMKRHYGHRCVYCGEPQQRLTQDHIIPLSKGGSHTLSNIVPACRSCNARKHTGPPLIPVQPLLLL